ncbi:glycoprotein endo-alpha-1,2-mannosidase isoform X2 [Hirundo rustica]|uniref:glycoprotein endo-alpha-1,2-mannosidase isoform X2 n=1 Tax=Hirundo rustica TaxID=43150 RepID=UPI001A94A88A|nr:glycoprotein endo-alpha-1,2-mannosidase isoform X2 [Hirundo rustica]
MARFRRRTCIILLLFILFICSIMMALKTLRPDRAGFGDPFGLGLLPELQQRTVLLDSKQNSLNRAQGDTVTRVSNLHSIAINTMKASMSPVKKLEEELSSPNYNFHIFYYTWYGNPQFDGKYIHWNHPLLPHWDPKIANNYPKGRHNPPEDIGANFYPELGSYSSKDPTVIEAHMKQMRSASTGVIVLSWYPPGMADENGEPTDDLVPVVLDYAHKYNLKVTFHIEPYKDRDDRSMYHNVKYIIDSQYICKTLEIMELFTVLLQPGIFSRIFRARQPVETSAHTHTHARLAFGRYFPTHPAEPAATRVQVHQILISVSENQAWK